MLVLTYEAFSCLGPRVFEGHLLVNATVWPSSSVLKSPSKVGVCGEETLLCGGTTSMEQTSPGLFSGICIVGEVPGQAYLS